MTRADECASCREAEHPAEHRACAGGDCECRCRRPHSLAMAERRSPSHNPSKMLDFSEVTVGCWVEQNTSADFDAMGRGGVVVDIDQVVDKETGEVTRIYTTAKYWQGRIVWAHLREADVDIVDVANPSIVRALWRAMAREIGKRKRGVMTEEMRLGETIPKLQRSVA